MGVRAAFTREQVEKNEVMVKHVRTDNNLADMLTKPLTSNRFTFLRNKLMFLLAVMCCLLVNSDAVLFEGTKPIIWLHTDNFVDNGITQYEVDFRYINPCGSLLPQTTNNVPHGLPPQNIFGSTDRVIADQVVKECNKLFEDIYVTKIRDLVQKGQTVQHNRPMEKIGFVDAAELVCVGCITNLVSTIVSRLNPHSDHNQMKNNKERIEKLEADAKAFEKGFNVTKEIEHSILATLQEFGHSLSNQNRQLQHLAELPRVSWISSYMQSRILHGVSDLNTIMEEYGYGRVATSEMADMLMIDRLRGVDKLDTRFQSISLPVNFTVRFKFVVRERSPDTFVYKVSAFQYWDNLTETPTLMEYQGSKYLIHNESIASKQSTNQFNDLCY